MIAEISLPFTQTFSKTNLSRCLRWYDPVVGARERVKREEFPTRGFVGVGTHYAAVDVRGEMRLIGCALYRINRQARQFFPTVKDECFLAENGVRSYNRERCLTQPL